MKFSTIASTCSFALFVFAFAFVVVDNAAATGGTTSVSSSRADIMPLPAEITFASPAASLPITENFSIALTGIDDPRLRSAIARLYSALTLRTGIGFTRAETKAQAATLVIDVRAPAPAIPVLGEDETYTLTITPTQAVLRAPTTTGALRGLQTLIQLVRTAKSADEAKPRPIENRKSKIENPYALPALTINDHPRFPWRGLMVDVARRWHPPAEIKRIIDGMELVKLNVLHLHLTDDQAFRIETLTHPELHTRGSDGLYFTQADIRDIIAYAAARAIRVVPEFDMPSHTTSWGVSHPELLSGPPGSTYTLPQQWPHGPVMDPTKPALFDLLTDFLGEMSALFPDAFLHIGGDENNGKDWNASARIQKFIADNHLADNHGLHAWFATRVAAILARNNKTPIGWEEILHSTLPPGTVIHSWRGAEGLANATAAGHPVILSRGYYIDLCQPATEHYAIDPIPADTTLTPAQQNLVLGGEATMWSEWTNSENIDSRLWPRAAAIAERLWTPRETADATNTPDLYRRLAIVSRRLEEAGMQHEKNRDPILRRLAGDTFSSAPDSPELRALRTLSDACEPVKRYQRGRLQGQSTLNPLGGFADATVPDSAASRDFNANVTAYLEARKADPKKAVQLVEKIDAQFNSWISASDIVATQLGGLSPQLELAADYAVGVRTACLNGQFALRVLEKKWKEPENGSAFFELALRANDKALAPNAAAIEFPAAKGIKQLLEAAAATPIQNTQSSQ